MKRAIGPHPQPLSQSWERGAGTPERDGSSGADGVRQRPLRSTDIEAICRRAFGAGVHLDGVRALDGGTVNMTYRLDVAGEPACVLRVAPSPGVVERGPSWLSPLGLRREYALTPLLAPVAPLLPRTLAADFTRQLLDRDWVIQSIVAGTPWSELEDGLTADERADLWRQLGTLTRAIHAVEGDAFGAPDQPRATWFDVVREDLDGIQRDWWRFDLPHPEGVAELCRVVERNRTVLDAMGAPRLVHSDLDPRHVFVARGPDGRLRISGLIDHEYGRFADPASESMLVWFAGESAAPAAFFETYGSPLDDETSRWRSLVYRAVALGWATADAAHLGRVDSARETSADLQTVVDVVLRRRG
ncbi:MAG: phosphotransferase [Chloroflexia bacterium]|nr:phosphotransferase [Chloroflexia bacterium]